MSNPAPGFAAHPQHRVSIESDHARVRVLAGTTIVADTLTALKVEETGHGPVWYVPPEDIRMDLLTPSDTSTYCPFKGHASYWNIGTPEMDVSDAVWSYQTPFDECTALRGYLAFYANKLILEIEDPPPR